MEKPPAFMEKTGLKIQEICLLTIAITNSWLVYTDKLGYVLKNLLSKGYASRISFTIL